MGVEKEDVDEIAVEMVDLSFGYLLVVGFSPSHLHQTCLMWQDLHRKMVIQTFPPTLAMSQNVEKESQIQWAWER